MGAAKKAPAKRKQVRRKTTVEQRPNATQQLHQLIRRGADLRDTSQGAKAAKLMARVEKLEEALQAMEKALSATAKRHK